MACPVPALSVVDVNQTVKIGSETLTVDGKTQKSATLLVSGKPRAVRWHNGWHEAKHEHCKDWKGKICEGKIVSADARFKGTVKIRLGTGKEITFENPALKDTEHPFDTACYRSKLCHSPKVCQSWKSAVCKGAVSLLFFTMCEESWYMVTLWDWQTGAWMDMRNMCRDIYLDVYLDMCRYMCLDTCRDMCFIKRVLAMLLNSVFNQKSQSTCVSTCAQMYVHTHTHPCTTHARTHRGGHQPSHRRG